MPALQQAGGPLRRHDRRTRQSGARRMLRPDSPPFALLSREFPNGQRIGANLQVISVTGGLLSLSGLLAVQSRWSDWPAHDRFRNCGGILKPFDADDKQMLRVVIETPKGSRNKFAFDPEEHIWCVQSR